MAYFLSGNHSSATLVQNIRTQVEVLKSTEVFEKSLHGCQLQSEGTFRRKVQLLFSLFVANERQDRSHGCFIGKSGTLYGVRTYLGM